MLYLCVNLCKTNQSKITITKIDNVYTIIINCIHLTFCFADGLILRTQRWNKLTIHDKSHQAIIKTRNGEIILKMQFSLSLSKLFDKICFFNEPIRLWTYFLFVRCDEMQSTPTVFSSRHFVVNVKPIVIRSPIIIICNRK